MSSSSDESTSYDVRRIHQTPQGTHPPLKREKTSSSDSDSSDHSNHTSQPKKTFQPPSDSTSDSEDEVDNEAQLPLGRPASSDSSDEDYDDSEPKSQSNQARVQPVSLNSSLSRLNGLKNEHVSTQRNRSTHSLSDSYSEDSNDNDNGPANPLASNEIREESSNVSDSDACDEESSNQRVHPVVHRNEANTSSSDVSEHNQQQRIKKEKSSSDESHGGSCAGFVEQHRGFQEKGTAAVKSENAFRVALTSLPDNERISLNENRDHFIRTREIGEDLLNAAYKQFKPIDPSNTPLPLEDISSDDEVWLIQCPKSMNLMSLKDQRLTLGSNVDIQINDGPLFKRFSVSSESSDLNVNCILPSSGSGRFHIASLPVKGKMVFEEHVHVPKLRRLEDTESRPVPFPTQLRVRHPLLGVDFEQHIASAKAALTVSKKSHLKKKSHEVVGSSDDYIARGKKRKQSSFVSDDVDEVDGSTISQAGPPSKIRRNYFNEDELEKADSADLSTARRKKKDKHKDIGSYDSLASSTSYKNKSLSSSALVSNDSQVCNSSLDLISNPNTSNTLKKHKKSKRSSKIYSENQSDLSDGAHNLSLLYEKHGIKKEPEFENSLSYGNSSFGLNSLYETQTNFTKRSVNYNSEISNSQEVESFCSNSLNQSVSKKHKKSGSNHALDQMEPRSVNVLESRECKTKKLKKQKKSKDSSISAENQVPSPLVPKWHIPQANELPSSVLDQSYNANSYLRKKRKMNQSEHDMSLSPVIKVENDSSMLDFVNQSDLSFSKKKKKRKHEENKD